MQTILNVKNSFGEYYHHAEDWTIKFTVQHLTNEQRRKLCEIKNIAKACFIAFGYMLAHLATCGLYTIYCYRRKMRILSLQLNEAEKQQELLKFKILELSEDSLISTQDRALYSIDDLTKVIKKTSQGTKKNLETFQLRLHESERIQDRLKIELSKNEKDRKKTLAVFEKIQEEKAQALKVIDQLKLKIEERSKLVTQTKAQCSNLERLLNQYQEINKASLSQLQDTPKKKDTRSTSSAISKVFTPSKEIAKLTKELQEKQKEIENLKINANVLNTTISDLQAERQRIGREIIESDFDREELKGRVATLTRELDAINGEIRSVGPVPKRYQIRTEDPNEIDFDKELIAPYQHASNMDELIKKAFRHTFEKLLVDVEEKRFIHFNRSSSIVNFPMNVQALYRLMVLHLLQGAKLETDGCDGLVLLLNEKVKPVSSSQPENVLMKKILFNPLDPDHPIMENQLIVRFKHHDEWTPHETDRDFPKGIDPVGAKYAIRQLSDKYQAYLRILLLEPLIFDSHILLKEAWRLSRQPDLESKNMQIAYELICDIANSISKNFSSAFSAAWAENAISDDPVPIDKSLSLAMAPSAEFVEWKPLVQYFPEEIKTLFDSAKAKTLGVWHKIAPEMILKTMEFPSILPSSTGYPPHQLDDYYYWNHRVINPHGCLFSALATHLFQVEECISGRYIQFIKLAMANYLTAHPEDYTVEMERDAHFAVKDYIKWLNGSMRRDTYALGDVELKLVSKIFGIRIEVLAPGISISPTEHKLIMPDPLMAAQNVFGPNTKEKLILYNAPGYSYYALFPKIREVREEDSSELKISLNHVQTFWKAKHRSNVIVTR